MKLVSYNSGGAEQLALLVSGMLYDTDQLHAGLPSLISIFLERWEDCYPIALECEAALFHGYKGVKGRSVADAALLAPVPHPSSLRDGYAFRQHVEAARRNRGVPMIPQFDQYPVFYFGNHQSVTGPGPVRFMPDHFQQLDFELECAVVISRKGRDIPAALAEEYIAGFMVMNDWSARTLQMEEMLLNLGPAKGKDFATGLGPWLVTPEELEVAECAPKAGHTGKSRNLKMTAWVNGVKVSSGNLADMDWTFAELIERASYGVTLHPGDIIGSGTVGSGCLLEINGTHRLLNPHAYAQWLLPGDTVELEIEKMGRLSNQILTTTSSFSLLDKKLQSLAI